MIASIMLRLGHWVRYLLAIGILAREEIRFKKFGSLSKELRLVLRRTANGSESHVLERRGCVVFFEIVYEKRNQLHVCGAIVVQGGGAKNVRMEN